MRPQFRQIHVLRYYAKFTVLEQHMTFLSHNITGKSHRSLIWRTGWTLNWPSLPNSIVEPFIVQIYSNTSGVMRRSIIILKGAGLLGRRKARQSITNQDVSVLFAIQALVFKKFEHSVFSLEILYHTIRLGIFENSCILYRRHSFPQIFTI